MVPLNMTYLHCLQHSLFEHLFNLYSVYQEVAHNEMDSHMQGNSSMGGDSVIDLSEQNQETNAVSDDFVSSDSAHFQLGTSYQSVNIGPLSFTDDSDSFSSDDDGEETFYDFSSSDNCDDDFELEDRLSEWARKFGVTHNSLRELLTVLIPLHPSLPKDPRTLLRTSNHIQIKQICCGLYHHFGVENGLRSLLQQLPCDLFQQSRMKIEIQINIDGLPLFKSSNAQFWPILGRATKPITSEPFVIGLYLGEKSLLMLMNS